jgi:hypothetical protein
MPSLILTVNAPLKLPVLRVFCFDCAHEHSIVML